MTRCTVHDTNRTWDGSEWRCPAHRAIQRRAANYTYRHSAKGFDAELRSHHAAALDLIEMYRVEFPELVALVFGDAVE